MKKLIFIIIAILMLDFTSAYGWGAKGHDVVAAIAEQNLTPKAKRKIGKLLDGKSIVYYYNRILAFVVFSSLMYLITENIIPFTLSLN